MTVEERYNLIKNSKYAEYMKETQAYERRNLTRDEFYGYSVDDTDTDNN